jgi:hypothetical protein
MTPAAGSSIKRMSQPFDQEPVSSRVAGAASIDVGRAAHAIIRNAATVQRSARPNQWSFPLPLFGHLEMLCHVHIPALQPKVIFFGGSERGQHSADEGRHQNRVMLERKARVTLAATEASLPFVALTVPLCALVAGSLLLSTLNHASCVSLGSVRLTLTSAELERRGAVIRRDASLPSALGQFHCPI